jgi:hypothetical protein
MTGLLPPPGDDINGWMDDIDASVTIEGLADSLVREVEAIHKLVESPVWVMRGEPGDPSVRGQQWREITAAERRERGAQ